MLPVSIRDMVSGDVPLIYDSWIHSCLPSQRRDWGNNAFKLRRRIDALIRRGSEVKVAIFPEDGDVILGWACAEPPSVLHYVYVKEVYRRQGVAATLLAACGLGAASVIVCTHWTKYADLAVGHNAHFRRMDFV